MFVYTEKGTVMEETGNEDGLPGGIKEKDKAGTLRQVMLPSASS